MGYTAKDLVAIAVAEIGYKEKASNSNLDSATDNAGSANYTKYARDLNAAGYYNGNKNGYAWCDVFVDWCFYQLTGKDKEKAEEIECQTGDLGAGCVYSKQYYQAQGRFDSTPQVGDQIFFQTDGTTSHTGIVEKIGTSTITTVEGNSGNEVKENSYQKTNSKIEGYGHPKYDAATSTSTSSSSSSSTSNSSSTSTSSSSSSSTSSSSSKTYTTYVTTANLNYRTGAGISYTIKGTIKKGNEVQVEDGYSSTADGYTWYRVKINNTNYYMAAEYLEKKSSSTSTKTLPTYKTGTIYTTQVDKLAVRTGAGTSNSKKTKSQLTTNAQSHAYSDGSLKKGTQVTCKGTKTVNSTEVWMQIPSGWVAAYYNDSYYVK